MQTECDMNDTRFPVQDYGAAIARAVEWLGERYLLAKPVARSIEASVIRNHHPAASSIAGTHAHGDPLNDAQGVMRSPP